MKLKEFDILLDIRKLNNPNIEVVQDDVNANVFNISLVDGLEPFDLSGCDVDLVVSKSDGTTVIQSTSSDPPGVAIVNEKQGKIRCVLKTNTIASPGRTIAEVKISESDVMLTSAQFEFYIRKSLLNDKTIESTNEFPVLKKLVEDTKNIIDAVPIIEEKLNEITSINSNLNQAITTGQSLNTDLSGIITDANTAKDALDTIVTTANNIKDELEDIIAGTDFEQVLYELNNKLDKDGDSKDNTVTFEEAQVDEDIESGETHSTIFGKILKAIKTLRSGKVNKSDIVQTAEVNDTNKIPSSAVTNGLKQDINELNNNLPKYFKANLGSITSAISWNNLIGNGIYMVANIDGDGAPVSYNWGLLLNFYYSTDFVLQIYFPHSASHYPVFRVKFDGFWIAWKRFSQ